METYVEMIEASRTEPGAIYLGPARVLDSDGQRIRLSLPEGSGWATSALAGPYRPEPEDVVLVIGKSEYYVIGVLSGRGRVSLSVDGDLDIEATGRVRIAAGRCVELEGARVSAKAEKIELTARTVFERFGSRYQWVKEAIQTRAGRVRTLVEGQHTIRAERIVESADKDVKVNGRTIHLG